MDRPAHRQSPAAKTARVHSRLARKASKGQRTPRVSRWAICAVCDCAEVECLCYVIVVDDLDDSGLTEV